ncbi:peptidase M56 family protein [Arthrobacter sp. ISL-69]|uniref:peptidase M56 family protein n=1 Tax=Arthrobacter sp. ISL-69 TaxID=2819113 RepID=UPI001BE4EA8E|nr:peptidase M56 family protein [Arthrobacter sp. ISL-69]MBT2535124.1 peptidase M56 family protein [Arthrobacter sp. ISL-69]
MNQLRVDDRFSNALEAELVSRVQKSSPARTRRRIRLWLGAGALAGAGLLGGIGAAAAGFFVLPGTEQVTPLASPVTETYTGTATVELGEPPEGTTGIDLKLIALTPGWFGFPGGASASFTEVDATARLNEWRYTIPLTPGQHSVTITTDPESRWQLTAKYVKQVRTALGVNAKGETYGVESPENGTPDLIAVMATNGASGYVYAKDLFGGPMPTSPEDAVKNFSTPRPPREIAVYLSDGQTKVGIFEASGSGGGIPAYPSQFPVLPTADAPTSGP